MTGADEILKGVRRSHRTISRGMSEAATQLQTDRCQNNPGDGNTLEVTASYSRGRFDPFDCGPIDRPSFALPTIFAALDPDPKRAAFEALYHASVTFQGDARQLHIQLREAFGVPSGTA